MIFNQFFTETSDLAATKVSYSEGVAYCQSINKTLGVPEKDTQVKDVIWINLKKHKFQKWKADIQGQKCK